MYIDREGVFLIIVEEEEDFISFHIKEGDIKLPFLASAKKKGRKDTFLFVQFEFQECSKILSYQPKNLKDNIEEIVSEILDLVALYEPRFFHK